MYNRVMGMPLSKLREFMKSESSYMKGTIYRDFFKSIIRSAYFGGELEDGGWKENFANDVATFYPEIVEEGEINMERVDEVYNQIISFIFHRKKNTQR